MIISFSMNNYKMKKDANNSIANKIISNLNCS